MNNILRSKAIIEIKNEAISQPVQLNSFLSAKMGIDSIARQYIPAIGENIIRDYELSDPINDDGKSPIKGLIHRYQNRVLLKITNQCEAYCRFCFRREFVGTKVQAFLNATEFTSIIQYLKANPQINEVIFSGGDPFVLSPRRLADFCEKIAHIEGVKSIRFHTRLPIQAPHKINSELVAVLKSIKKPINIVIHTNHFSEIDEEVKSAILKLKSIGIGLFSQSVLLAKINDCPDVLEKTFNQLFELSIKPYYLHHTDLARGTSHFAVPLLKGLEIYRQISSRLSGLALPKYMLDLPNGSGKIQLCETKIRNLPDGNFEILDNQGNWQFYPNIE